jgi:Carboxypeptidase regulatory-like domain
MWRLLFSLVERLPCHSTHGKGSDPIRDPIRHVAKRTLGWALLCTLLMVPDTNAQIRSGTIAGLATDPSGAVVFGADVAVTNTGTHQTFSARTTVTGPYTVPYLEAGTYSISVTKAGFETVTVKGLLLNPEARQRRMSR